MKIQMIFQRERAGQQKFVSKLREQASRGRSREILTKRREKTWATKQGKFT